MNWFVFFLIAFILSSLLTFALTNWAKKAVKFSFRTGGIAIISSFVIVTLTTSEIVITSALMAILLGSIVILLFGLWDDCKNFNWKIQLLFQLLLALILIWFGFEIDLISFSGKELLRLDYWSFNLLGNYFSVVSGVFIVFWLIGIINAVNWLDGSDGLLSTAGILSLLAVFFVSLRPEVNQPALAIVSVIGVGALAGFFIFNFPSAKIEAGTSGSYFVGFLLASLAIIAGTKISTTMVVLILPVTDFCWVIIERVRDKQSIFKKDNQKRHLHYKLLSAGLSPRQILLGYALFLSLALLISFFVVNQTQKILLLIVEFVMISLFMLSLPKKINFKKIQARFKKMLSNPVWLISFIIFGLITFSIQQKYFSENSFKANYQISIINKTKLKVRIVQAPEETYQGLSGFNSLPSKNGMLFLYSQMSPSSHVMRDMLFDLDFIFLRDNRIVFIKEQISKNFKGTIQSPIDCNQVLEINAGEVKRLGVEVGDVIEIGRN